MCRFVRVISISILYSDINTHLTNYGNCGIGKHHFKFGRSRTLGMEHLESYAATFGAPEHLNMIPLKQNYNLHLSN